MKILYSLFQNKLVFFEILCIIHIYGPLININVLGEGREIPLARISMIYTFALGLLLILYGWANWSRWLPMLVFALLSLVAIPFSDDPLMASVRYISFLGLLLFCIGLSAAINIARLRDSFARLIVLFSPYTFISLISLRDVDAYNYMGNFVGYIESQYAVSFIFSFIGLISLAYFVIWRQNRDAFYSRLILLLATFNLFASVYLIFYSTSRIGVFNILVSLVVLLIMAFRTSYIGLRGLALILLSSGASFYWSSEISSYIDYVVERGLTGRELGVNYLINTFSNTPSSWLFGFGGGGVDRHLELSGLELRDSGNLPAIIFDYGIFGLICYIWFFIAVLHGCFLLIMAARVDLMLFISLFIFSVVTVASSPAINFLSLEGVIMFVSASIILRASRIAR